jgi:hypothetical protein
VIAVPCKILDADLGIGEALLDHPRNILSSHAH